MKDKEKRIIEERTYEATRKGLLGFSGKLGVILRYCGQPIVVQSRGFYETCGDEFFGYSCNTLDDYLGYKNDFEDQPTIETMDVYNDLGMSIEAPSSSEWNPAKNRKAYSVEEIGWYFQSLSSGVNLELKYLNEKKELTANYKGYLVFKEVNNELKAYAPDDEWEKPVDFFYKTAKQKEEQSRKKEKDAQLVKADKNKEKWLESMKKFWGFGNGK